jgi:hypothetical protein
MRFPLTLPAIAIATLAIAACSAGQSVNTVTPPAGSGPISGPLSLSGSSLTQSTGTAGGVSGVVTYPGGTGIVAATSSATNPAGTTVVTPSDRARVAATAGATSPNVYYVTISSTAGATLNGLPAVNLVLSTAAVGTFQEAQFSAGAWANVAGATASPSKDGLSVGFPQGTTTITIPAGGSIFLAFYQGSNPTLTGPAGPNVLADPGFEGTAAAFNTPITSTGWTQCSVSASAPGAPAPNQAFSTTAPGPTATPGAAILAVGTSIPVGSAAPVPTVNSVIVAGGTHAAVFGGQFTNFDEEDLRYNGLCQTVKVPNNPGMTLSVLANGNDFATRFDLEVDALNTSNQFLGNIFQDVSPIVSGSAGDTAYRSITVSQANLTPFVGQTINLFVGAWVKDGNFATASGYYFVDNLNLTGTQ